MTRRRRAAALAAAAGGAALLVAGCAAGAPQPDPTSSDATNPDAQQAPDVAPTDAVALAESFLDTYVDDGRVVRLDQGDDTVSEGQAYGMLLAVVADDVDTFDEIWTWTQTELQRDDGLLAWQWADGAVVDDEPASDAELDAARALVLAGERFGDPTYTDDGVALGAALLDRMTVETDLGRVLVAGTWAAAQSPYGLNPSYASPVAFAQLGDASGDPRWAELAAGSADAARISSVTAALPPDWAQVHDDGRIEAMPGAAGGGQSVRYGYDAFRLPIRYAESCDPADVQRAALLADPLETIDPLPVQLDLGGGAIEQAEHPVGYVGRAAVGAATGDAASAESDLGEAAMLAADGPTYYGEAWRALGAAMLTTDLLGSCAPLATSPEEGDA